MTNVLVPLRVHEAEDALSASPTTSDDGTLRTLSPELALVDPDLAAAARLLLPDPVEPEPTRRESPALRTVPSTLDASPVPARAPSTAASPRRTPLPTVVATGLVAVAAAWVFGFSLAAGDRAADEPRPGTDSTPAALQAEAARQARAARTYTWPSVPGAATYEFEIRRGSKTVFETTTRALAVELPARLRLSPGRYTWAVTPTYENQSAVFVRRPVVEATFEVPSS